MYKWLVCSFKFWEEEIVTEKNAPRIALVVNNCADRESGFVKKINRNKGFAFIRPDCGGEDIYTSLAEVQQSGIYESFHAGVNVSFRRYFGSNSRYRATDLLL